MDITIKEQFLPGIALTIVNVNMRILMKILSANGSMYEPMIEL